MKVLVGLSGGVDSAVAAYLLKKQGFEVIGAFMRNWDSLLNNDILGHASFGEICPQEQDYNDAKSVADVLRIPLYRVDFVKEYWDDVFAYFLAEYKKGRTPNPDVVCNKKIKFAAFLKFAAKFNVDYVATGHYAKISREEGKVRLYKARDLNKDQSYFLADLSPAQLANVIFPLADITKPEARKIAAEAGLTAVQNKKDSTGICFIGERDFRRFLQNYIPAQPGDIVDLATGEVLGRHEGVMYYTIGQRHGFGLGGVKNKNNSPWFVAKKDIEKRLLYVSQDESVLERSEVIVKDVNWINKPDLTLKRELSAKFRYREQDTPIKLEIIDERTARVSCLRKVRAITPGQFCVFYAGDECLGGGVIEDAR